MKLDVIKLDGGKAGSIDLNEALFGLEPRVDILHRVVRWQRNNAQAGTHKVKTRSEVSYSTKKIYRQKGTGGARHGARSAPIFRGGGVYKGPTPRSHGHDLPKKVRALGLKGPRRPLNERGPGREGQASCAGRRTCAETRPPGWPPRRESHRRWPRTPPPHRGPTRKRGVSLWI